MSLVMGTFCFLELQKSAEWEDNHIGFSKAVNEQLTKMFDDNERFYLSLDQSTTCTGISIRNTRETVLCQMDFLRLNTPKELFIEQLYKLVSNLVRGLRLSLIVIEKPLPIRHSRSASVLNSLAREIKSWQTKIDEFYGVPFDSIFPQQWKEKVLDKKKGKHRYNIKSEIAKDVCDIFPMLNRYRQKCLATDFDSFDATGIMSGYLRQHFSSDGSKINFGSAVYNSKMHVFVKYLPSNEVDNVNALFEGLPRKCPIETVLYNEEHSLYDNLRMICSQYEIGSFVVNDPLLFINLLWESKVQYRKGFVFVCVVTRQGYLTQKQLEKAQKSNPYFYMA